MTANELLNILGQLVVGRRPAWSTQSANVVAAMPAPTLDTDGVSVQGSVLTLLSVTDNVPVTTWTGELWGLADGTEEVAGDRPGWRRILGSELEDVEGGYIAERYNIAGFRRLYFQITAIAGGSDLNIAMGPCVVEV